RRPGRQPHMTPPLCDYRLIGFSACARRFSVPGHFALRGGDPSTSPVRGARSRARRRGRGTTSSAHRVCAPVVVHEGTNRWIVSRITSVVEFVALCTTQP